MKPKLEFTNWQKNIITGTVFGGSSLLKQKNAVNYQLHMAHQNSMWLKYKIQELADCFTLDTTKPIKECPIITKKNNKIVRVSKTFRCQSRALEALTEMHDLLYDGDQRIVTAHTLYPLQDIGLAVWFLESGGRTGRDYRNLFLNSTRLGEKSTDFVVTYFNEMGIECHKYTAPHRIRIIFSTDASEKFLKIIAHRIPACML